MSKQVTLEKWGKQHFDPPPSLHRLRAWAKSGLIQPKPVKIGREYRVAEDAKLCMGDIPASNSPDPVVAEIWNNV